MFEGKLVESLSKPRKLVEVKLFGSPYLESGGGCFPCFTIHCPSEKLEFDSTKEKSPEKFVEENTFSNWSFKLGLNVDKDVCFQFFNKTVSKETKHFHFWVHTALAPQTCTLNLNELDGIKKTRSKFPASFTVSLLFEN